MLKNNMLLVISILMLVSNVVRAADLTPLEEDKKQIKKLTTVLESKFNSIPTAIQQSVIPNLYQVLYGTEVVYVTSDGEYFLAGDLIHLNTRKNLSDDAKKSVRNKILERQDNKPVTFKAKDEKHVLTVFTDIDCPYCTKLHREIPELNQSGITVKYLMFPRAGIKSKSYDTAVSMWCSDDNQHAMTEAKARRAIPNKTCENPIAQQYNLGKELGISGTPALITSSGNLIPGYMSAKKLTAMLQEDSKN